MSSGQSLFLGAFLSLVMSFVATLVWFWIRKPRLSIDVCERYINQGDSHYFLAELSNARLPGLFRGLRRESALQCSGEITYFDEDGVDVFGEPIPILWTGIEPFTQMQAYDPRTGDLRLKIFGIPTSSPLNRVDIHPGNSHKFHVAMRMINDDPNCYVLGADQYLSLENRVTWRKKVLERPLLFPKTYSAKIKIISSGEVRTAEILVINKATIASARLEMVGN